MYHLHPPIFPDPTIKFAQEQNLMAHSKTLRIFAMIVVTIFVKESTTNTAMGRSLVFVTKLARRIFQTQHCMDACTL